MVLNENIKAFLVLKFNFLIPQSLDIMFLNEKVKPFFASYFAFLNEKKALFLKLSWFL